MTAPVLHKHATFDSTDDGNVGPCADVLVRLAGADRLGFCTAFPSRGVSVCRGQTFLHDELLSESPKRFDPLTPMPDPNLVRVLGRQTRHRVGLVPHAVLASGRAAAEAHIDRLVAPARRCRSSPARVRIAIAIG